MDNFVNLHMHSMYSIQDSVIKIPELAQKLLEYDQSSCAITDHSSCAGWIEFSREMTKNNIKPIFGNEFYCRDSYDGPKTRDRDHLVMLAMTDKGLTNISILYIKQKKSSNGEIEDFFIIILIRLILLYKNQVLTYMIHI